MAKVRKTKKKSSDPQLRVTAMLDNVKKTGIKEGSKISVADSTLTFTAKNGKKTMVPVESVISTDAKYVQYRLPARKIFKGAFIVDSGFYFDKKQGIRIAENQVIQAEEIVVKD